jgi:molybdate transport system ATP-binding protein
VSLDVELLYRVGEFELDVRFATRGGITALFGPSGAGKTLTLRAIAGLIRPQSGRVAVADHLLFDSRQGLDVPTRRRRIGYVFQQYALFPHLHVADNVGYALDGDRRARTERIEQLLRLVGLQGYGTRMPRQLSGGEQQRVALARAMAPRPDLILLDEPFSALDARVRRRLRAELRRIHETTGVPMVLVTHSYREMRELADWLVLYDGGRVLRSGATAEVLGDPGSEQAAALLEDGELS